MEMKESEKVDKYQDLETGITVNHRMEIKESEKVDKYLDLATGVTGDQSTNRDHPDNRLIKIKENAKKILAIWVYFLWLKI